MFGSFLAATHCVDSPGENSVDSYHEPRFHVYPNRTGNGDVALCPYFPKNDENRDIGLRPHFQIPFGLASPPADTDDVLKLLETLGAELERPRELSARVVSYIVDTYGIDHDAIGSFLVDELSRLEEYELDLILSPVFTPKLADQAVFAELLGGDSIPREQWPALIQQLVARPTRARLVTSDGRSHSVTLREVTLERYVHRLRLDATISESLFKLLDRAPSAADRGSYRLADALELLNLVERDKPADLADLLARIPQRQQALQEQVKIGSGSKPFFSEQVQALHGGGRDQRQQDDIRLSAKQNELAFLDRLQKLLAG